MPYGPRSYYVYVMSNASKTLYVGVTSNPERRIWEHRTKVIKGFTERYNITMLVHLEEFADPNDAIAREKQLKGWIRARKLALVQENNPHWLDLAADWYPVDTPTES
jgi:putative endonuclease